MSHMLLHIAESSDVEDNTFIDVQVSEVDAYLASGEYVWESGKADISTLVKAVSMVTQKRVSLCQREPVSRMQGAEQNARPNKRHRTK